MEYIRAFLAGGAICAVVQLLMDKTKLMPGRIMVLLVVSGAILGSIGLYEPFGLIICLIFILILYFLTVFIYTKRDIKN